MSARSTGAAAAACLGALLCPLAAQAEVVPVPSEVLDAVGALLPERSNAGAAFLAPGYSPNLVVTSACEVRVIFLWEGSRQESSLGWFTWDETGGEYRILDSGILFPRLAMGPKGVLRTGSASWVASPDGTHRSLQAGERMGFFLIPDGYKTRTDLVTSWRSDAGIPASTSAGNALVVNFTTIPELNPEAGVDDGRGGAHVAMVRMAGRPAFLGGQELLVMGFEDADRTVRSDEDFNDCVFLVDVQPHAAIDRSRIASFDPTDVDGDGVAGVEDAFPSDPTRAWVRRVPQLGYSVIAFEDFYPQGWDGDFNDAVLAVAFVQVVDTSDRVTDVLADVHLVARGASYDHEVGLHLPGLPAGITGTVQIERFLSGATASGGVETRDLGAVVAAGRRIDRIFASTVAALPRAVPDKPFANTWLGHPSVPAASARVWIRFDTPVGSRVLGTPPYDPYLFVTATDGTRADVHLPGFGSFPDRSPGLPPEGGPRAFLDVNGSPWAILVPTSWRYPLEGVPIGRAYPEFVLWRDSHGRNARTWYEHPTAEADKVADPIEGLLPPRSWALRGPGGRL